MSFKKFIYSIPFILAAVISLTACDGFVYEKMKECKPSYKVRFVYDMNLKWADAFPSEVHSVNLYIFDEKGIFVKDYQEAGEELSQPGFAMDIDLQAGDYTFVAWCGLENEGTTEESFTITKCVAGETSLDEFICRLNTERNSEFPAYSDSQLQFLYHGMIKVNIPEPTDNGEYIYTLPLIKDTNHIRIILQQLSGDDMDSDDFGFMIEAANGEMAYDNSLLGDVTVAYMPWDIQEGEAGIGKEDTRGLVYVDGVIADLSIGRMMASQENDVMLSILNRRTGALIAKVPIIQYALLSKSYYENAYHHSMTDQEFLDREDEYIMTFFLDKDNKWIDSYILIHSWRIVLHSYSVGGLI